MRSSKKLTGKLLIGGLCVLSALLIVNLVSTNSQPISITPAKPALATLTAITPPPIPGALVEVTDDNQLNKYGVRFNRLTGEFSFFATWTNNGGDQFVAPLQVVIESISSPNVTATNPDGYTPDGKPYFDYSSLVSDGVLGLGETSEAKSMVFNNPTRERFTFEVSFWAGSTTSPALAIR